MTTPIGASGSSAAWSYTATQRTALLGLSNVGELLSSMGAAPATTANALDGLATAAASMAKLSALTPAEAMYLNYGMSTPPADTAAAMPPPFDPASLNPGPSTGDNPA